MAGLAGNEGDFVNIVDVPLSGVERVDVQLTFDINQAKSWRQTRAPVLFPNVNWKV